MTFVQRFGGTVNVFFGVLIRLILAYWAVAVVVGKPPAHPGASSVGVYP